MRDQLRHILRCPACHADRSLTLEEGERDAREVRSGTLTCGNCKRSFELSEGIVELLHDPPEHVRKEAAGLDRFADTMRADGWDRQRILNLPYEQNGYWYVQATSLHQVFETLDFEPGQALMDVGSNTCWASAAFAEKGLDVISLDIAKTEMQGLRTAEYWFEDRGVYFDRVLGTMYNPPIASDSLDFVFCCEVLHHNDAETLPITFAEIYRALKPGGRLIVINETMKFPLDLKRDHAQEVAQYEGYEHTFFFHQYWLGAKRAGFDVEVLEPRYHHFFRGDTYALGPDTPLGTSVKVSLNQIARKTAAGRRAYLAYRNLVAGDVSLNMVCEKPASP